MFASDLLPALLDGIIPAFAVLVATAVITVVRDRRKRVKELEEENADFKAGEVPQWGVDLQQQNERIVRSLYGDPPWGAKGFFEEFGEFKDEVTQGIARLTNAVSKLGHGDEK